MKTNQTAAATSVQDITLPKQRCYMVPYTVRMPISKSSTLSEARPARLTPVPNRDIGGVG